MNRFPEVEAKHHRLVCELTDKRIKDSRIRCQYCSKPAILSFDSQCQAKKIKLKQEQEFQLIINKLSPNFSAHCLEAK